MNAGWQNDYSNLNGISPTNINANANNIANNINEKKQ